MLNVTVKFIYIEIWCYHHGSQKAWYNHGVLLLFYYKISNQWSEWELITLF